MNPREGDPAHCQPGLPTPVPRENLLKLPVPPQHPLCAWLPRGTRTTSLHCQAVATSLTGPGSQAPETGNLLAAGAAPNLESGRSPPPHLWKGLLWTLPSGGGPPISGLKGRRGAGAPLPSCCSRPPHSPASSAVRWQRAAKRSSHERGGGAMAGGAGLARSPRCPLAAGAPSLL